MKIKSFVYEKDSGETSNRTIIVTKEPTRNLHGIDLSKASSSNEFIERYSELRSRQIKETEDLMNKYGVGWRQFKVDNIKDTL